MQIVDTCKVQSVFDLAPKFTNVTLIPDRWLMEKPMDPTEVQLCSARSECSSSSSSLLSHHHPVGGASKSTQPYFSSTTEICSGIFSSESERSDSLSGYSKSKKRSATHCAVRRASGSWSQHSSMEVHTIWMPCGGRGAHVSQPR